MFSGFQKNHQSDTLHMSPVALEFFTSELGIRPSYIHTGKGIFADNLKTAIHFSSIESDQGHIFAYTMKNLLKIKNSNRISKSNH